MIAVAVLAVAFCTGNAKYVLEKKFPFPFASSRRNSQEHPSTACLEACPAVASQITAYEELYASYGIPEIVDDTGDAIYYEQQNPSKDVDWGEFFTQMLGLWCLDKEATRCAIRNRGVCTYLSDNPQDTAAVITQQFDCLCSDCPDLTRVNGETQEFEIDTHMGYVVSDAEEKRKSCNQIEYQLCAANNPNTCGVWGSVNKTQMNVYKRGLDCPDGYRGDGYDRDALARRERDAVASAWILKVSPIIGVGVVAVSAMFF